MLLSQKINETYKSYFEIEKPEKYIFFLIVRYLNASIWQNGGLYEWEKPLQYMMMDYT